MDADRVTGRVTVKTEDGWRRLEWPSLGCALMVAGASAWDIHEREWTIRIFIDEAAHGLTVARAAWSAMHAGVATEGDEEYHDTTSCPLFARTGLRLSRIPAA